MSRILIIDDDPGSRLIMQSRLAALGHDVAAADSGAHGMVDAHSRPFDLFLVAAEMNKGIDGFEVCKRLKAMRETASVPLILFNQASSAHESIDRAYHAGCDAYATRTELAGLDHLVRLLLKTRQITADLVEQNRALQEQGRKHSEERHRSTEAESRHAKDHGEHGGSAREIERIHPDGVLIVDGEGAVRHADRGACELLGNRIVGRHLASLVPSSRLEAFVRDAHIEARDGFRFDVTGRKGGATRSCLASVMPLVPEPGESDTGLRVVLITDLSKRKLHHVMPLAAEVRFSAEEHATLLEAARNAFRPEALIGTSQSAIDLRQRATKASRESEPVLIIGAVGTGKTRLARTLHYHASSTGPFLHVRCAAQTQENLELCLFGCAKGADENGGEERTGLVQQAQSGTLYLDGIGALSGAIQNRLLRVLADRSVSRKGSHRVDHVDLRLVASNEVEIENQAQGAQFSADLLAQLSATKIWIPPLAARADDVEPLAIHFLRWYGARSGVVAISEEATRALVRHAWPGNIAELEVCIEQACARASGSTIELEDLPRAIAGTSRVNEKELRPNRGPAGTTVEGTHAVDGRMREVDVPRADPRPPSHHDWDITEESPVSFKFYEQQVLKRALQQAGGDKLKAAKLLKVGKSTLYRKLKRYGIH